MMLIGDDDDNDGDNDDDNGGGDEDEFGLSLSREATEGGREYLSPFGYLFGSRKEQWRAALCIRRLGFSGSRIHSLVWP